MATAVIYDGVIAQPQDSETSDSAALFAGQKLWFSHTVPQRQWLMQNAQSNGAVVTDIDTQAEIILFDHARKNAPPGSISYKYVELSIRNGILESVEDHRIASESRSTRPVGSVRTAAKATRSAFTDAEDQLLWNWIRPYMDNGGQWKGNEIYKQLERFNSRHTFQSWRDRWIKHTQFQGREVTVVLGDVQDDESQLDVAQRSPKRRRLENSMTELQGTKSMYHGLTENANSPVEALHAGSASRLTEINGSKDQEEPTVFASEEHQISTLPFDSFTKEETQLLFWAAPDILNTKPEKLDQSWAELAEARTAHSKDAWKAFFETVIVPEYRKRKGLDTEEKLNQHIVELMIQNRDEQEHKVSSEPESLVSQSVEKDSRRQPSASLDTDPATVAMPSGNKSEERSLSSQGRPPGPSEFDESGQERSPQHGPLTEPNHTSSQSHSLSPSSQGDEFLPDIPHRGESQPRAQGIVIESERVNRMATSAVGRRNHVSDKISALEDRVRAVQQRFSEAEAASSLLKPSARLQVPDAFGNQEIPHQSEATSLRRPRSESPMFVPEHSSQSSLGLVALVDEGSYTLHHESHDSDYAPSETASMVDFLDTPELSIGWDTAPEQQDIDSDSDETHEAEGRYHSKLPSLSSESAITSGEGGEFPPSGATSSYLTHQPDSLIYSFVSAPQAVTQFETAITEPLNIDLDQDQQPVPMDHSGSSEIEANKSKVQVAHEGDNEAGDAMFMIPIPEGGWSDDEDVQFVSEQVFLSPRPIKPEKSGNERDHERRNFEAVIQPVAAEEEEDDDDKMHAWLASQTSLYADVSPLVCEEVCIKSLEATSLQYETTSELVKSLISLFRKGKHSALAHLTPFAKELASSSKRKRNSKSLHQAISTTIDEMMPTDQQGVWTKADDQNLTGTNARGVQAVERKHGEAGVRLRFEYLEQLYKDE